MIEIKENLLTINRYSRPGLKLKSIKGIVIHWVAGPGGSANSVREYFETLKFQEKLILFIRNYGNDINISQSAIPSDISIALYDLYRLSIKTFPQFKEQLLKIKEMIRYACAHYAVGLKGEIIHMIPDDEIAYHVGANSYKKEAIEQFGSYPNNCLIGIETCHLDWSGKFLDITLNSVKELCVELCKKYNLDPIKDIVRHHDITGKDCPKWFVDHPEEFIKFKEDISNMLNSK